MDYGTPRNLDQVEEYYTHIRRGRKPEPELLQDLIDRYQAIGGVSPLNKITDDQIEGLGRILNGNGDGVTYRMYSGKKHIAPFVEDAVRQMVEDGIREAVGFVFAPHYSTMSIAKYIEAAEKGVEQYGGPRIHYVRQWHLQPLYLDAMERRLRDALSHFSEAERPGVKVLFTAHSLPERILKMNDPYPDQIRESAAAIAQRAGHSNWGTAWQSAGRTPEPWLGPDILDVLRELAEQGTDNVVICPFGFVADHLEVLYDIDIEAQALAKEVGIKLVRTAMLNADEDFLRALATVVRQHAAKE
ncbi:ferrochelatase [Effusibacillus lacus]|nr:ferrochelatase [Effusibacillus lacus]